VTGISGWETPSIQHGFLLDNGTYTTLDVPGSTSTQAWGINDSGEIVGTYADAGGGQHGFLATPVP
jgi:probable HAF family extracellular repeat protein